MNNAPKYVTKYFELKDRQYYESGQIRVGTLGSYRAEENRKLMGARFDPNEGVDTRTYEFDGDYDHVDIGPGGILMKDCKNVKIGSATMIESIDCWVFCAKLGNYSKRSHEEIITEGPNGYTGNPKLLSFAVFEAEKLIDAIGKSIKTSRDFVGAGEIYAAWDEVKYEAQKEKFLVTERNFSDRGNPASRIFIKDPLFQPEGEFRIAVRSESQKIKVRPILLKSELIRESITHIGP